MLAVGFGGSIHDYATIVADRTKILCGIEDERLTRERHAVNSSDPLRPSYTYCEMLVPEISRHGAIFAANDTLQHCRLLNEHLVSWLNHHFAHAASVFFTSAVEEAAVLVIDGAGSVTGASRDGHFRETSSLFHGRGNELRLVASVIGEKSCPPDQNDFEHPTSNSIGDLYETVTSAIGFRPLQEGKTMALAAFGDDRFVSAFNRKISLGDGFDFRIELFGAGGINDVLRAAVGGCEGVAEEIPFDVRAALAYAAQHQIERIVSHLLGAARRRIPTRDLCISGGVALNAVLIGKLPIISDYERIHVISAPGDSGTAVGAALSAIGSAVRCREPLRWAWTPYLGREYPELGTIPEQFIGERGDINELADRAFEHLLQGEILAIHRGRSEFGPRALGHRSIIAFPNIPGMLSRLNRLKSREWFRPVAPMTLQLGHPASLVSERLMQSARPGASLSFPDRPSVHVDGSARVQLIDRDSDPFILMLLERASRAGINAVLNTSFNLHGQPIVETPAEALTAFGQSKIQALVLGSHFITKRKAHD